MKYFSRQMAQFSKQIKNLEEGDLLQTRELREIVTKQCVDLAYQEVDWNNRLAINSET